MSVAFIGFFSSSLNCIEIKYHIHLAAVNSPCMQVKISLYNVHIIWDKSRVLLYCLKYAWHLILIIESLICYFVSWSKLTSVGIPIEYFTVNVLALMDQRLLWASLIKICLLLSIIISVNWFCFSIHVNLPLNIVKEGDSSVLKGRVIPLLTDKDQCMLENNDSAVVSIQSLLLNHWIFKFLLNLAQHMYTHWKRIQFKFVQVKGPPCLSKRK